MSLYKNRYRIESARLPGWDYTQGRFFVTICTAYRRHFFGKIIDGEVQLSPIGQIVADEWQRTAIVRRHALDPEATTRRTNVEIKREKKRELEELVKEVGWPRVKTKLRFLFCLLIKHFHQLETENSQLKADLERDHSEAVRLAALLSKLDAQVKLVRG